jgi:hypothetical protein
VHTGRVTITETALLKLCNDILWNIESHSITALVAIDLSAAFDTVDHSVLLDVLHSNFGVSGKPLEWFHTYLCPRSAAVQVKDVQSRPVQYDISVMGYADYHSLYMTVSMPVIGKMKLQLWKTSDAASWMLITG